MLDLYLIKLHKIIPSAYTREGDISTLGSQKEFKESEMPGFGLSLFTILPVILMLISTIVQLITGHEEAKIYLNKLFTS